MTTVLIPPEAKTIDKWAFRNYTFESLIIPNHIQSIEEYAFNDCTNLKSVVIPDSVTSIGKNAFDGCPLTSIVLSKNLTSLSNGVFCGNQLVSFTIPDTILSLGTNVFYSNNFLSRDIIIGSQNLNINGLTSIEMSDNVTRIGPNAFSLLDKLIHIKLSSKLTELPDCTFIDDQSLQCVDIPNCVTKIGQRCFENCPLDKNKVFILHKNIEIIDKNAFNNCKFKEVVIEGKIKEISDNTFTNCLSLSKITLPETVTKFGDYSFENCGFDQVFFMKNLKEFGFGVFSNNKKISELVWDENFRQIPDSFVKGCVNITKIVISSTVTAIGQCAFYNCKSLIRLEFPNSVVKFGNYVCKNCEHLKNECSYCAKLSKIRNIENITEVEQKGFNRTSSLFAHGIPNTLKKIGSQVFSSCGIKQFVFPNIEIYDHAFSGNSKLTKVVFSEGVKTLPNGCFNECPNLKIVEIPNSVESIGDECFSKCSSLEEITIPNDVKTLGNYCFNDCKNLKSVIKNEKLIYDRNVFSECLKLTTEKVVKKENLIIGTVADIPFGFRAIENSAFEDNNKLEEVIMPDTINYLGENCFKNCTKLTKVVISKNLKKLNVEDFAGGVSLKEIVLPDDLKTIEKAVFVDVLISRKYEVDTLKQRVFENCEKLEIVVLPDNLNDIKDSAFTNCKSLKELVFPLHLKFVGKKCFQKCEKLERVVFNKELYSMGNLMFGGCISLKEVVIDNIDVPFRCFDGCTNLEKVEFKINVKVLNKWCFRNCKALKEITLPKTLKFVDEQNVFVGCDNLEKIIYSENS
ncbi:hypothetical protein EIN_292290 [Entamoeba invadens IP1]|uniref:Leucine rich repeat containing protein BspA family protein n=1 Tax=Entamoeba invadens IP1 TaxID=370355 RepID=A0A0A1UAP6_ENTIV|nr:hypothetical protein EIN_292290 [Entamoeba invadens IP1]ELP92050.1 hypothetical protein EIN_292290 [Entamoeba invadens IP1]|eukprot:XP_004258821.1 hypothetical protein EIN_292290 [Entamoeba invadens IP1]